MRSGSINRLLLICLLLINSFFVYSQTPTNTNVPVNPGQIPTTQPNTQVIRQNPTAGNDKVKELENENAKGSKISKDSLTQDNLKSFASGPKSTYGANALSSSAAPSIAELSTPPLDYPIGVGDHIIISLYEGAELQKSYLVGKDGAIFPEGMGKIFLAGYTFENARRLLYARFAAVVPAGTNIDVTLGQPRTINVNVINEVNNPGIVTVSAFTTAYNVIQLAGGITENGNLRNIQIKRNGRVIEELDVYKYLQTGEVGKRLYLQNNDFIIVPFYEKKVLATGQFKRPMYYQLRKDEGVKALLKYSGGLNADALISSLKVISNSNESQILKNINALSILRNETSDATLKDGDIIKADLIKPGYINKVEIRGEIKYPDYYELRQGEKLFDLINKAGGITKNTYLQRAYIFRGAGDSVNLQPDKLIVDLTDLNSNDINSVNNIQLLPNDVVQLFGSYEFADQVFVEIFGEVRKEGKINKYGGMTLQDLIYLSGGIKQSAEFGRLEISSIVDIDSAKQGLKPTRTIVKSYAIPSNLQLDSASAKIILKPYDQVFVRKNPTFELQQNIGMQGLVKYPGLYPRLDKYEKLSSYIARAGGFKENADLSGAVLYRRKTENFREKVVATPAFDSTGKPLGATSANGDLGEPVSIDLYKALKYKNSKYDIILQENDLIFIPEINPFVSVKGVVQSPLKIQFDKEHTNVRYYIDKAGGYGVRPWRSRVFVKYANGKSRRTRNILFFHFYPPVEEGSVVTIPSRPAGQDLSDIAKSTVTTLVPLVITSLLLKYLN